MKKLLIIFILGLILINGCSLSKFSANKNYLPKDFSDLYLGMPLNEFEKVRDIKKMERSELMDFRYSFEEVINSKQIKSVTYYFDKDNNQPLYELIIEYYDRRDLEKFISSDYGEPNYFSLPIKDSKQWKFNNDKFDVIIWSFENKVIVAGNIKDTEWEN